MGAELTAASASDVEMGGLSRAEARIRQRVVAGASRLAAASKPVRAGFMGPLLSMLAIVLQTTTVSHWLLW